MNREELIAELAARGYQVAPTEVKKNGIVMEGIIPTNDKNIRPVIYTDQFLQDAESIDDAVNRFIAVLDANTEPTIDADNFNDRDWILKHISIALQRSSDEQLVKKACELDGIEQYLILRAETGGAGYSAKVTPELLANVGISNDSIWDIAYAHICQDTIICSMAQVLAEIAGADCDFMEGAPFYVVTNSNKVKGASAILNKAMLKYFATEHQTEQLLVIPSSINEMLIMPYDGSMNLEEMSAMVKEVNATQVAPEERLADKAYIITL